MRRDDYVVYNMSRELRKGRERVRAMIKIQCDECGSVYKVSDDSAGKTASCSKCQNKIRIPGAAGPTQAAGSEPEPTTEKEIPRWKRDRIKRARRNTWVGIIVFVLMVGGIATGLWIARPWEGLQKKNDPAGVAAIDKPKPVAKPSVQPPKAVIPVKKPTARTKPIQPIVPLEPEVDIPPVPDLAIVIEECKLDMFSSDTAASFHVMVKVNKTGDYKDIVCKFTDVTGKDLTYRNSKGEVLPRASNNKVREVFTKGTNKSVLFTFKKAAIPPDKIKYPWITSVRVPEMP
jgi:hypothetical protein